MEIDGLNLAQRVIVTNDAHTKCRAVLSRALGLCVLLKSFNF